MKSTNFASVKGHVWYILIQRSMSTIIFVMTVASGSVFLTQRLRFCTKRDSQCSQLRDGEAILPLAAKLNSSFTSLSQRQPRFGWYSSKILSHPAYVKNCNITKSDRITRISSPSRIIFTIIFSTTFQTHLQSSRFWIQYLTLCLHLVYTGECYISVEVRVACLVFRHFGCLSRC